MSRTARQTVKAYRAQAARFADPARVSVGRAGAAFLAAPRESAERLPETMDALAANGHLMTYRVTGRDAETGRLTYSQWDAWHADACLCQGADPVPEW